MTGARTFLARTTAMELGRTSRPMNLMMQVSVSFQDERLEFDVPDEQVVTSWSGPAGLERSAELAAIHNALHKPWDFPPIGQMIVPGDRVVIAFDPTIAGAGPIFDVLTPILRDAGVEQDAVTVLVPSAPGSDLEGSIPAGSTLLVHDPDDRTQLAYLAATKEGERVYLNRLLTDADVVIPVGKLGFDPIMGYRGPWSVIYPGLSERSALDTHRGRFRDDAIESRGVRAGPFLDESFEVSWLLGSQFHVGVVPGASGLSALVAGREQAVRERGIAALGSTWTLNAPSRAELVVVGIGGPGVPATIDDLAAGLMTACRLVQHGGKIVVLSRVRGNVGASLRSLIDADDPRKRTAALRGHERDDDFVAARRLAQALAWADVYVLSELAPELVDDLSLVALGNPEQARRLVARSGSCSFVSHAELCRAEVAVDVERSIK